MQAVFTVVALLGLGYFLFAKRRFDALSLAYIAACLYFLPGFFGYSIAPNVLSPEGYARLRLEPEAYVVMIVVLLAITVAGLTRQRELAPSRRAQGPMLPADSAPYAAVALVLAVFGFLMTIATTGPTLLEASKDVMLQALNRWHILYVTCASLGAVLGYAQRKRFVMFASMGLLLFDVYIGLRVSFAIAALALFMLHFTRQGSQRIAISQWRLGLVGIIVGVALFIYKSIYIPVKLSRWDVVAEVLSEPQAYVEAILRSEPFVTQSILNEIIRNKFVVGFGHLPEVILQLMLFADETGVEITSFNSKFQSELFPGVQGGMASNIWAEMWSAGGWPLLLVFLVLFVAVLRSGSRFLQHRSEFVQAGTALMLALWGFYFHRNTLAYQLNLEKRIALMWIALGVFGYFTLKLRESVRRQRAIRGVVARPSLPK